VTLGLLSLLLLFSLLIAQRRSLLSNSLSNSICQLCKGCTAPVGYKELGWPSG
jgi:hypothetical protein